MRSRRDRGGNSANHRKRTHELCLKSHRPHGTSPWPDPTGAPEIEAVADDFRHSRKPESTQRRIIRGRGWREVPAADSVVRVPRRQPLICFFPLREASGGFGGPVPLFSCSRLTAGRPACLGPQARKCGLEQPQSRRYGEYPLISARSRHSNVTVEIGLAPGEAPAMLPSAPTEGVHPGACPAGRSEARTVR